MVTHRNGILSAMARRTIAFAMVTLHRLHPSSAAAGSGGTFADHGVTSAMVLRALTGERELLPRLLEADALSPSQSESARKRLGPPVGP